MCSCRILVAPRVSQQPVASVASGTPPDLQRGGSDRVVFCGYADGVSGGTSFVPPSLVERKRLVRRTEGLELGSDLVSTRALLSRSRSR